MKDSHDPIVRCSYTELKPVGDLQAHPANPNKHPDEQIKLFVEILRYQGCRRPVTVSKRSGYVIRGHGQLMAYKLAGWQKIPVDYQDYDDTGAELADLVADNQLQRMSEMQTNTLQEIVGTLDDGQFDLTLTGIPETELEELMTSVGGLKDEPEGDEDAVPEVEDAPVVKRGDTWILGNHRLRCGDSTSAEDVALLMNGEKADMVFTDPPYNIDFKPPRGTHQAILNDNMNPNVFKEWLKKVVIELDKNLQKDSYLFVWSGWSTIDQFAPVLKEFFTIKAMPIWIKNNFGIGYYSRPKYEPFFLCLKGEPKRPETAPADVWEFAKVAKTIHSCEKPVGLIMEILNTYQKSGSVLDLFGGSGSTLIACEKTGRKCFMMELDEKYCEVIIRRWQEYTGKEAIHAETGKTFDATKEGG